VLTDQQLTEAALRLTLRRLTEVGQLHDDEITGWLDGQHPPADDHEGHETQHELQVIREAVKEAVRVLRFRLADHAEQRGVVLKLGENT